MEETVLLTEPRPETGTPVSRRLRKSGRVPAVVYGAGGETVSVSVDAKELGDVLRHGARVIALQLPDGNEDTIIREMQHDALGSDVIHVDFLRVSADQLLSVSVPITLHGTAPGVEEDGGVLEQQLTDVEVSCLPANIPEALRLDVSQLVIGDVLHLSDLALPDGVALGADPELAVVTVRPPAVAEEEEAPAEVEAAAAEPELIAAKREEEGEGAAGQE